MNIGVLHEIFRMRSKVLHSDLTETVSAQIKDSHDTNAKKDIRVEVWQCLEEKLGMSLILYVPSRKISDILRSLENAVTGALRRFCSIDSLICITGSKIITHETCYKLLGLQQIDRFSPDQVEHMCMHSYRFNIFKHVMVPTYTRVGETEIVALEKKFNTSRKHFPKILRSDPICLALYSHVGDVYAIEHEQRRFGRYYRIVV